ncbi:phosphoribosylglycinamide formyltransferase, chloroplastic isoform X2 [Rhododendron vialii]|uniref:phosphoribosylglycinamide formyltransferase, chloroplastic isoform X2 n=1 Tax=Rhododendron vialii TaxID=182163 RepID=UPI00265EB980|nr:phosphoribosylglycinamide formyltransferase, chloroplastic isoform X2 [Rhododendron vialii]
MEARSFISGFCSNPIINNPIQNPSKASFPAVPSYSNQVSFKTLYSLSWKLDSCEYKLRCRSSLQKVEAVSGDTEGLKSGDRKKNLAVFVSGGGSNFRSIHEAIVEGSVEGEIVVLVTNKPGCGGAEYARDNNIPVILFPGMKEQPDVLSANDLVTTLRRYKIDFILLAGYLKLIPVELVRAYPRSILNIHPSLLPAFGGKGYYGMKVHQAVIASGARYSGPTIHFVDEHYDTGRILAQRVVPVLANDTADELAARVLQQG